MTEQKQTTAAEDDIDDIKRSMSVIGTEIYKMLHKIAPREAQAHFKSAHVEALKGLRVLIDRRIDSLSSERKKGTTIPVE